MSASRSEISNAADGRVALHRSGSEDEPVILENAICDGCGHLHQYVQVVNGAPAANICLCRGCIEAETPRG